MMFGKMHGNCCIRWLSCEALFRVMFVVSIHHPEKWKGQDANAYKYARIGRNELTLNATHENLYQKTKPDHFLHNDMS